MQEYQSDIIIVGGGLAGMITALELLDAGKKVLIIDRDIEKEFGGLAKWAFGGMFFVDSKLQRRNKIKDSIDLATKDWYNFASFSAEEKLGKEWADLYINTCTDHGYKWLIKNGIKFFPVLNWAERGLNGEGNSVPRFHMVWGTGWELVKVFRNKLLHHKNRKNLTLKFEHRVLDLIAQSGVIQGVRGKLENSDEEFTATAEVVVVATGGINGSIEKVKANWHSDCGDTPPEIILNGAHKYAIGDLHDATEQINGNVVNLKNQWNYAAGIRHYKPRKPNHGLSLVPCKTAVWLNYEGKRFHNYPLLTATDTRYLVQRISKEKKKYSWQVLNMKIAYKEFAISGSEHNPAVRDKNYFAFIKNVLLGNKKLVHNIIEECEDVIIADTIEGLAAKMNALTGSKDVDPKHVQAAIEEYDRSIDSGAPYQDWQQQKIFEGRKWRGDKARVANMKPIGRKKDGPFVAIRNFILSRKSLGGIQTDLQGRVLTTPDQNGQQEAISGLYAVGEAAGFGGGGMHGLRSLEGTFLGGCVITGRVVGKSILDKKLV